MTSGSPRFDRIVWIVLDSVGIGELPDAAEYGDVGRDTLGHIARSRPLKLPNLVRLGLANIKPLAHLAPPAKPAGSYGKGATVSPGKDTTTGHWEMAGIWLEQAFPVYPHGFPRGLIAEFERQIGRRTLGNKPASGTEIIKELGEEHVRTGFPIVYTSGDSVFQIAAHEDVIPVRRAVPHVRNRAQAARRAEPRGPRDRAAVYRHAGKFSGAPSAATTMPSSRRGRCCSMCWPNATFRSSASAKFTTSTTGAAWTTTSRRKTTRMAWPNSPKRLTQRPSRLIFANLVDFDMLYGHRKDVEGFARSLEEFDALLGPFLDALNAVRSAADHRRPRLRSRSCESHYGSFARICADPRVQPAACSAGRESGSPVDAGRTWGRRSRRISARRSRTETSFLERTFEAWAKRRR